MCRLREEKYMAVMYFTALFSDIEFIDGIGSEGVLHLYIKSHLDMVIVMREDGEQSCNMNS